MNRNKYAVLLLVAAMLLGLVTTLGVTPADETFIRFNDVKYGQLDGNTAMLPTPDAYTVLVLPQNWEQDPVAVDLWKGFGKNPALIKLRNRTEFVKYRNDHPDFQHRFAPYMPKAANGQAAVLVVKDNRSMMCKYGDSSAKVAKAVTCSGLLDKIRPKPQPGPGPGPCPGPECRPFRPQPEPQVPTVPEIPETPDEGPPVDDLPEDEVSEPNQGIVLATLAGAAGLVWMAFFRGRM